MDTEKERERKACIKKKIQIFEALTQKVEL